MDVFEYCFNLLSVVIELEEFSFPSPLKACSPYSSMNWFHLHLHEVEWKEI